MKICGLRGAEQFDDPFILFRGKHRRPGILGIPNDIWASSDGSGAGTEPEIERPVWDIQKFADPKPVPPGIEGLPWGKRIYKQFGLFQISIVDGLAKSSIVRFILFLCLCLCLRSQTRFP